MLYSVITYASGKAQTIMFQDQEEADVFYKGVQNYLWNSDHPSPMYEVYDNGQEALINVLNVEKITKPSYQ